MRTLTIFVVLGFLLHGPAAVAQPAGTDEPGLSPAPPAAMPAPPVAQPSRRAERRMDLHRLHAYLVAHDPAYRSARRMRLSGILLSSVGGGLGALVAVIGLAGMTTEGLSYGRTSSDHETFTYLVTAGLTTMVVAVAVGLPLTLVGHGRMKRIRRRHLRFHAGVLPGGGVAGLSWQF